MVTIKKFIHTDRNSFKVVDKDYIISYIPLESGNTIIYCDTTINHLIQRAGGFQ